MSSVKTQSRYDASRHINYISTAKKKAGVPAAEAYNSTLYLMSGLLLIGLIANLLVRPVDARHHLTTQS